MIFFSKEFLLGTIIGLLIIAFGVLFYFDKALTIGLALIIFLTALTFFLLDQVGVRDKGLFFLFFFALFFHLAVTLFFHYTQFQPLGGGGGDFVVYHQTATEIAKRFSQGIYSLKGLNIPHYYPVIIGFIYSFTLPKIIIGELFSVWLAALSVLFVFLIVKEVSGSKKWAFLIGLIVTLYPSYLFYGSFLLKDTLIVPLVLAAMLSFIKMMKSFGWRHFLIFYILLTGLIHFRFYVGYAVLFSFLASWFFISSLNWKKRIPYGLIIIFLLGFSPQALGYGYYGTKTLKMYLNPETITVYREVVYAPTPPPPPVARKSIEEAKPVAKKSTKPTTETAVPVPLSSPIAPATLAVSPPPPPGLGSSFLVKTGLDNPLKFIRNSLESFIYSLLGPFPWQIKYKRQLFVLLEMIPWYFLLFLLVSGFVKNIHKRGVGKSLQQYRLGLPLLLFSIMSLGAVSLFVANFGIITRIRIPSFIALLCLLPFHREASNKLKELSQRYHEKKIIKFFNLSYLFETS